MASEGVATIATLSSMGKTLSLFAKVSRGISIIIGPAPGAANLCFGADPPADCVKNLRPMISTPIRSLLVVLAAVAIVIKATFAHGTTMPVSAFCGPTVTLATFSFTVVLL